MTPLTGIDTTGDIQRINGEINAEYVHRYKTQHYPDLEEDEVEEMLESIDGVKDIKTEEIVSSTNRYSVEAHLESVEAVYDEIYCEVVESTTAWNQTS